MCVCVCLRVCMRVCTLCDSGESITVLELGCDGVCETHSDIDKLAILA